MLSSEQTLLPNEVVSGQNERGDGQVTRPCVLLANCKNHHLFQGKPHSGASQRRTDFFFFKISGRTPTSHPKRVQGRVTVGRPASRLNEVPRPEPEKAGGRERSPSRAQPASPGFSREHMREARRAAQRQPRRGGGSLLSGRGGSREAARLTGELRSSLSTPSVLCGSEV